MSAAIRTAPRRRLAVIGPSWFPLSEPYQGGQEALVAALVTLLRERGHCVLLYAHPDTDPGLADEFVPFPRLPRLSVTAQHDPSMPNRRELADHHAYTGAMADLAGRCHIDAVLNHGFHELPLAFSSLLTAPVVTTLHAPPMPRLELGAALAGPDARYVAVSSALADQYTTLSPPPDVVRNGIRVSRFAFGPGGDDLVWVGRITPEKGTHLAIDAARAAGRRLKIVGPVYDSAYYDLVVRPVLGAQVDHLGHLSQADTAEVVGHSAVALVTPRWDEPFGLVAAESTVCGTPVVAVRRGGLAEVVEPGTGVLVDEAAHDAEADLPAALAAAIPAAEALDRACVRRIACAAHSGLRMVTQYEAIVEEAIAAARGLVVRTPA